MSWGPTGHETDRGFASPPPAGPPAGPPPAGWPSPPPQSSPPPSPPLPAAGPRHRGGRRRLLVVATAVLVVVAGVAVTRVVATRGDPDSSDPGVLVVAGGAVYLAGYDVLEVDPSDGTSELILDDIFATDVAVVGDRLVIAGTNTLGGLHLPLPPPDERVTGEVEVED